MRSAHCLRGLNGAGKAAGNRGEVDDLLQFLAQNRLAAAMHSGFADTSSMAMMTFADPAGSTFYVDWERAAQATVANLRLAQGRHPHDPRLRELVTRLSAHSGYFRDLWESNDVRGKTFEAKRFEHPDVGALELTYQALEIKGAPGLQLVVYRAERNSRSANSLRLLASLVAPYPAHADH